MMQALEDDDDFVAELLKREAKEALQRHATGARAPIRRRPDAPKPNLRFLKNVLRDVGSHNAELKAKEEEQSQRRAREVRETGNKRRREDDGSSESSSKRTRTHVHEREGRWKDALSGLGLPSRSTKEHKSSRRNRSPRDGLKQREDEPKRKLRRERSRSRSSSRDAHEKRYRRRHKHRSRTRSRTRSPERRHRHSRQEDRAKDKDPTCPARRHQERRDMDSKDQYDDDDSDPLEAIVGPMPPPKVKARGRGNTGVSSSIDARFRPDYDPKMDVQLDEAEDDDWDMAVEAFRDRAKWKASGAERLKAAGFTDTEVERWEKGGEKGIEDVRWSKKGEAREWDQGKVMDDDGEVQLKPEWGRLKGT